MVFCHKINGEDVRSMSHEYTVRLIKETRETLIVKVIAPKVVHPKVTPYTDGTQTLPLKRGTILVIDCMYLFIYSKLFKRHGDFIIG